MRPNVFFALAAGTNLQYPECPAGNLSPDCQAAFMGLHLTQGSSAYLEVGSLSTSTWNLSLSCCREPGSGMLTTISMTLKDAKQVFSPAAGYCQNPLGQYG